MALQLYQVAFLRSVDVQCKLKQSFPHILKRKNRQYPSIIKCGVSSTDVSQDNDRLAIYQPTIWSHDFIEALDTNLPVSQYDV